METGYKGLTNGASYEASQNKWHLNSFLLEVYLVMIILRV